MSEPLKKKSPTTVLRLVTNSDPDHDPIEHRFDTIIEYMQDFESEELDDPNEWVRLKVQLDILAAKLLYIHWRDDL